MLTIVSDLLACLMHTIGWNWLYPASRICPFMEQGQMAYFFQKQHALRGFSIAQTFHSSIQNKIKKNEEPTCRQSRCISTRKMILCFWRKIPNHSESRTTLNAYYILENSKDPTTPARSYISKNWRFNRSVDP